MKQQSTQAVQSTSQDPDKDWQILAEIEMPLGVNAHSFLDGWLLEALAHLNLHADFLNKIRQSVADVAERVMQTEMVLRSQRFRLLVMIPVNHPSDVQTWGFFRIEKVELAAENKNSPNHIIEFYLFPEGQ